MSTDMNPEKVDFPRKNKWLVRIGVSRAHVHLSQRHVETLFGKGNSLTIQWDLGQAGQYAARETVNVVGMKGVLQNVRIIGPERSETQVEVSRTDTFILGIDAPLRDSGNLAGTPGAVLIGPKGVVVLERGCIIPKYHIHMLAREAEELEIVNLDKVSVLIIGEKIVGYHDVMVRLVKDGITEFHIDTDEANAAFVDTGDIAMIDHKDILTKDNIGNLLDVNSDLIKFTQAKYPLDRDVLDGISLLKTVFDYHGSVENNIIKKLQQPESIKPNKYYLFTASERNKIIGIASFYWIPAINMAYLEYLGIMPDFQNRGIGIFLFHKVIAFLEKNHPEIEGVLLEVRQNKESIDDRERFFLNAGAISVDKSLYPSDKIKSGQQITLMFKPEIHEAILNSVTMEIALRTLNQIL
ncbi:MAG TPA: phosphate propanoyltransferase [Desulfitobacteriaceae bacterium]|nr:phosphate propanoyltransferase [Desulfitobacteriaceae bacterium]